MSLEQNSPRTNDRPETWNADHTLRADTVIPAPEHRDDKDKKKGSLKNKIIVGLAGLGLAAGGGLVAKGLGGGNAEPAPERTPAASATPNPGETATPGTAETETVDAPVEYGISAAEFENNPEAIPKAYNDQLNAFRLDGATKEAYDSNDYLSMELHEFVDTISTPVDQKFVDELFIENWDQNPALADYVLAELQIAQRTRELRLLSYNGVDNADMEAYYRERVIESTETTGKPIITTSTLWSERDNGPKTSVDDNSYGTDVNTFAGGDTFVWVNEGGKLKISDVSPYEG